MKHARKLMLLGGLLGALAATALAAGPDQSLKADVPFGFNAGNAVLPAGEYEVARHGAPNILSIRSAGNGGAAMVRVTPAVPGKSNGATKLVFHKYGDRYFLSEVWPGGRNTGFTLPRSSAEREFLAQGAAPSEIIVALVR